MIKSGYDVNGASRNLHLSPVITNNRTIHFQDITFDGRPCKSDISITNCDNRRNEDHEETIH